jgi:hypothetical protein
LLQADEHEWSKAFTHANVSPDGRFLVFTSHARLTPDDTSISGAQQVFRYDAQTGDLIRISVGNDGFDDNGNRSTRTPCVVHNFCSEDGEIAAPLHLYGEGLRRDSTMSDNGSYVFFESPVGLTPQALDDASAGSYLGIPLYAENVYEWHDGHVYLISDGRDTGLGQRCPGSCLFGSDSSGANVFFSTVDSLVPQDVDTELDRDRSVRQTGANTVAAVLGRSVSWHTRRHAAGSQCAERDVPRSRQCLRSVYEDGA